MEPFSKARKRIGDMLIEERIISNNQLTTALEHQKKSRKQKLGTVLVELGYTDETEIAMVLKRQLGLEYVELSRIKIAPEIINLVKDHSILKKYIMMPYDFDPVDRMSLRVVMADPMDIYAMDDLNVITGMPVSPTIGTESDIMACIDRYFGSAETQAVAEQYTKERAEQMVDSGELAAAQADGNVDNAPMVILVKRIIEQAVRMRASDIHIEPMESKIRVRNRVDGIMLDVGSYPINILAAVITRVKIIAGMDISEKRKPQDGRITQMVDRMEYDIRVSSLPTVFGEKIVLRLTSKMTLTKDKVNLGFSLDDLKKFDRVLSNSNGIILVTGPTGSGKSTTLYTALSELNTDNVNIVTVEDPVEANLDGINQVQVNTKSDLTFATALRSILRQDPDIIMIGEIRDEETAGIAVTASITGHLVVSTLHTNNAASSITRLGDMGIAPYLIADAVVGVIAQRLVRKLCNCKVPRPAFEWEKDLLNVPREQELTVYDAKGCTHCNDTGYLGRIGIYEVMPVTARIKEVINKKGSTKEIQEVALKDGMVTLSMSAVRYVLEGITSISEMRRVTFTGEDDS